MEDFPALVESLGTTTVAYIGADNLDSLYVFVDPTDMSAHIEIGLSEHDWDLQSHAIDKMIEIRDMFIDELSIDYRFIDEDSSTSEAASARQPDFALASCRSLRRCARISTARERNGTGSLGTRSGLQATSGLRFRGSTPPITS